MNAEEETDTISMLMSRHVLQLIEYHATLEVQITEWTAAGLIAKIEVRVLVPVVEV